MKRLKSMQAKKFADTDFFLALMKESDWLKEKAKKVYYENKDNIWISPFTVVELMIICNREKIPIKETLIQVSRISKLILTPWQYYFKACDYIKEGATIFDALLMSFSFNYSENSKIISSDNIYEKFGFEVIDLKK